MWGKKTGIGKVKVSELAVSTLDRGLLYGTIAESVNNISYANMQNNILSPTGCYYKSLINGQLNK